MKDFPDTYQWWRPYLGESVCQKISGAFQGTFKGKRFQHITLKQGFTLKEKRSASWIGKDGWGIVEMIFDTPEDVLETLTPDNVIETK